jgi:hypothetical protein
MVSGTKMSRAGSESPRSRFQSIILEVFCLARARPKSSVSAQSCSASERKQKHIREILLGNLALPSSAEARGTERRELEAQQGDTAAARTTERSTPAAIVEQHFPVERMLEEVQRNGFGEERRGGVLGQSVGAALRKSYYHTGGSGFFSRKFAGRRRTSLNRLQREVASWAERYWNLAQTSTP